MNKKLINVERVFSVISLLFIIAAFVVSIIYNGDSASIIPHTEIVLPVVHGLCVLLTLFIVFKPSQYLRVFVLFMESAITIVTNYEILGIMFFYCALTIILVNDLFSEKMNKHLISFIFVIHLITILLSYSHGWPRTILSITTSCFFCSFYLWIYSILKAKLSCLMPSKVTQNAVLQSKKPGSEIYLSEFNLTDRQKKFIIDFLHNQLTYKDLSDKYFVSISTVKKEFTDIFKVFEVSKLEELHILLLQYQVKE